jgi:hypothetical protein
VYDVLHVRDTPCLPLRNAVLLENIPVTLWYPFKLDTRNVVNPEVIQLCFTRYFGDQKNTRCCITYFKTFPDEEKFRTQCTFRPEEENVNKVFAYGDRLIYDYLDSHDRIMKEAYLHIRVVHTVLAVICFCNEDQSSLIIEYKERTSCGPFLEYMVDTHGYTLHDTSGYGE